MTFMGHAARAEGIKSPGRGCAADGPSAEAAPGPAGPVLVRLVRCW